MRSVNRSVTLAATLAAAVLAGCGGGEERGIGQDSSVQLQPFVAGAKERLSNRDPDGARPHLNALRARVEQLRAEGRLSEDGAARVLRAAGTLEARLPPPTTTTTATSPPVTAAPAATTIAPAPPPEQKRGGDKKGDKDDD